MDLSLAEKVAVVTGGSRGIDKAIARALAREGTNIALIARNISVCETTAMELTKEAGQQVRAYRADTGEDTAVHEAFAQIVKDFGRLDILVNAAAQPGGQAPPPKLMEICNENFWPDMNVKVLGYLRCAREAALHMMQSGWGRIINISGLAARSTGSIIGSMRNAIGFASSLALSGCFRCASPAVPPGGGSIFLGAVVWVVTTFAQSARESAYPLAMTDTARRTGPVLEAHQRFILWLVPAVER